MARLKLLLTCDYEVFGDGSGSVDCCMIAPSAQMMDICERYQTKMTFFVEVCEYWAFKEMEKTGVFPNDYRPATLIETQVKEMVQRGHDVQLHFHPQWLEYSYKGEQEWELNYDYWRLPKVPNGLGTKEDRNSLLGLFAQGKESLEQLIRPIKPDYECTMFRAGAWCIQPEAEVLQAMELAGMKIDSTLAPQLKMDNTLTYFDFSNSQPSFIPYPVLNNIQEENPQGKIIEYPIWTAPIDLFRNLYFTTLSVQRKLPNKAPDCKGQAASKSVAKTAKPGFLKRLWQQVKPQHKMLDFCGKTSAEELIYLSKKAIEQVRQIEKKETEDKLYPLVAIGHPKNFGNPKELEKWLEWLKKQKEIEL